MIFNDKIEALESLVALNMALHDNELSREKSENTISQNLVAVGKITVNGNSFSGSGGQGLMITEDGWVITAYHVIEPYVAEWKQISREEPYTPENAAEWLNSLKNKYCVVRPNYIRYPIDVTVFCYNEARDIALIKAVTSRRPRPIKYKVALDLFKGEEVTLLSLDNFDLVRNSGYVTAASEPSTVLKDRVILDVFHTSAHAKRGYSGSIFTNKEGAVCGVTLFGSYKPGDETGESGGTDIKNILSLVKENAYQIGTVLLGLP